MYIAIYCSVIVVFCALVVTLFVLKSKKDKKRFKKLNEKNDNEEDSKGVILNEGVESPSGEEIRLKEEKVSESVEFETFSLEEPKVKKEEKRPFHINPFDMDEEDEKDEDVDDKFAEYERFLRENLDLDDEEEKDEPVEEDDLRALRNFDYNSIKGKSESEIKEIIKNLPPKAQEILMTDILARKNWDDEN